MWQAWAQCFNSGKASSGVYSGLAHIMDGLARLEVAVSVSHLKQHNKELYSDAIRKLRKYASIDALNSVNASQLSQECEESINRLLMLDDVLPIIENRKVDLDFLASVKEDCESILNEMPNSGMNDTLSAHISYHLTQVIWAIDNFDVIGLEGLTRTYGTTAAELLRVKEMRGAKEPLARAWLKRSFVAVTALGTALVATGEGVEAVEKIITHSTNIIGIVWDDETPPTKGAQGLGVPKLTGPRN